MRVYIGTYTSGGSESKGIYMSRFDAAAGTLTKPELVAETEEPSFLTLGRNGKYLYAVNETLNYEDKDSGFVSAFAVDHLTGSLKFLNRQPSHGAAPCYISIAEKSGLIFVANYMSGNVAVFPVTADGSLAPASDVKQHEGRGPNTERQRSPHAHCVVPYEKKDLLFVTDLGTDRVMVYSVDARSGKLTPTAESYSAVPGAGPRHFKVHPDQRFAFVNNELDMTVTSLGLDERSGKLREIHSVSTLPEGRKDPGDSTADMHVSADGRSLYVSNRGHDSIASFSIDKRSGRLTPLEIVKTGGKTPRNFAIDPTGKFLLAANQNSDSITVFRIDAETGKLTPTGPGISAPRPVCLIFS